MSGSDGGRGHRGRGERRARAPDWVSSSLRSGESVVLTLHPSAAVTWPRYIWTLGFYGLWRKRQSWILTTDRVLVGRGVLGRSERSLPFDHVEDVVFSRHGYAAYVDVELQHPHRVERIGPLRPSQARRATSAILART